MPAVRSSVRDPDFKIQRCHPKRGTSRPETRCALATNVYYYYYDYCKKGFSACSEEGNYKAKNYSVIISLTCPIVFFLRN